MCPATSPAPIISTMASAAKNIAMRTFDARYAPGGAGNARLSFRSPDSRSVASVQPMPNIAGPITAEYLGIRPRLLDGTNIGGSSFVAHALRAARAIATGEIEVALITYASTQRSDGGKLSGDLSAFAATWNKQAFNQGAPKPGGATPGGTARPSGTYDPTTRAFSVTWSSQIVGGPFNSGILALGPVPGATYNYQPAPPAVVERVQALERVVQTHGVPLAAAALQFPFHHPAVAAVIPGARAPSEVEQNLGLLGFPVPAALWRDLKTAGLVRPDAPTPG